jgi:hypothetical protein
MKTVTAIALILGIAAIGADQADAHGSKRAWKKHTYHGKAVRPQVRGYIARGGGYAYEYEFKRPLYQGLYAKPQYSTDLTFWERINTEPRGNSNEVGPSGF